MAKYPAQSGDKVQVIGYDETYTVVCFHNGPKWGEPSLQKLIDQGAKASTCTVTCIADEKNNRHDLLGNGKFEFDMKHLKKV